VIDNPVRFQGRIDIRVGGIAACPRRDGSALFGRQPGARASPDLDIDKNVPIERQYDMNVP